MLITYLISPCNRIIQGKLVKCGSLCHHVTALLVRVINRGLVSIPVPQADVHFGKRHVAGEDWLLILEVILLYHLKRRNHIKGIASLIQDFHHVCSTKVSEPCHFLLYRLQGESLTPRTLIFHANLTFSTREICSCNCQFNTSSILTRYILPLQFFRIVNRLINLTFLLFICSFHICNSLKDL